MAGVLSASHDNYLRGKHDQKLTNGEPGVWIEGDYRLAMTKLAVADTPDIFAGEYELRNTPDGQQGGFIDFPQVCEWYYNQINDASNVPSVTAGEPIYVIYACGADHYNRNVVPSQSFHQDEHIVCAASA